MTNSTPTRLLFRRKITAVFADGSSKMNLGIATVVRMLKGVTNVPVEVAADAAARKLLAELARNAGRTVERAAAGVFLTPPVVQPGVDQRAVPIVPSHPRWPQAAADAGERRQTRPENRPAILHALYDVLQGVNRGPDQLSVQNPGDNSPESE